MTKAVCSNNHRCRRALNRDDFAGRGRCRCRRRRRCGDGGSSGSSGNSGNSGGFFGGCGFSWAALPGLTKAPAGSDKDAIFWAAIAIRLQATCINICAVAAVDARLPFLLHRKGEN